MDNTNVKKYAMAEAVSRQPQTAEARWVPDQPMWYLSWTELLWDRIFSGRFGFPLSILHSLSSILWAYQNDKWSKRGTFQKAMLFRKSDSIRSKNNFHLVHKELTVTKQLLIFLIYTEINCSHIRARHIGSFVSSPKGYGLLYRKDYFVKLVEVTTAFKSV